MKPTTQKAEVLVLFDQLCSVCRVLAGLMADESPSHWRFRPWQEYKVAEFAPESWNEKHPTELRVVAEGLSGKTIKLSVSILLNLIRN